MAPIAELLATGATLLISIRHGRGCSGAWPVFAREPEVLIAGFEAHGSSLAIRCETGSIQPQNRALGVRWSWLAFERR